MLTREFQFGKTKVKVVSENPFWFLPPAEQQAEFERLVKERTPWAVRLNDTLHSVEDSLEHEGRDGA